MLFDYYIQLNWNKKNNNPELGGGWGIHRALEMLFV